MRLIQKGKAPRSLVEYGKSEHATYEGLPTETKADLRKALLRDQGELCCYCMGRIHSDETKRDKGIEQQSQAQVRIEHWKSQSDNDQLQLDWGNLFAACHGNEGKDPKDQHCDVRKGKRKLTLDPLQAKHISALRYGNAGQIQSTDPLLQQDIDEILNLNHVTLQRNRKDAIRGMIDSLHYLERKRSGKTTGIFSDHLLRTQLAKCTEFDSNGRLPPFAGALAYWLKKRLGLDHAT